MARHNRDGRGTDQRGFEYEVSYQPDWLRMVKVTRKLETGRQSTKTLFRNPADRREQDPGERIRTRIVSPDQGIDVHVTVEDPTQAVHTVKVTYKLAPGVRPDPDDDTVEFTLENDLPPATERG